MLSGADTLRSPAWWLARLGGELADRRAGRSGGRTWSRGLVVSNRQRPPLDLLDDHVRGDPPLLGCAEAWRENFREVARMARLNVATLAVEAKSDRMTLRGFRTAAADDELGDRMARDLMVVNDLEVKAPEVHDGMLALADSYAMVVPPSSGNPWPLVTVEDAREVITAHDPVTGQVIAALKMFRDDWDDADRAYLFIRDGKAVRRWVAAKRGVSSLANPQANVWRLARSWEWETAGDPVPLGRMPVVRFRNRRGVGEFERHLDTIDRINDQILDKLVIAKIQAFRQRGVKGLPATEWVTGSDGRPEEREVDYTDVFTADPGALWLLPADVDIWESAQTDFRPLLEAIKDDLEHFAAVTATPLHIITPDAASGSAEGASLMREQHIFAVGRCQAHATVGWREVIATCFAFRGDTERADATQIQPIWGPTERHSLSESTQAAAAVTSILPREAIWTDVLQYPPTEVDNLRIMQGRDLLYQADGDGPAPPA